MDTERKAPPAAWMDPRCEVRVSPVAGSGVFATRPIAAGEIVQVIGGQLVTPEEFRAAIETATTYVNGMQIDDGVDQRQQLLPQSLLRLQPLDERCLHG